MADDFDLSTVVSPMRAAGLDPSDPKALALFSKMAGGGVGLPSTDTATAPANPSTQPNRVPAAVTPSGNPQGQTLEQKASERAYQQLASLPNAGDEFAREQATEEDLKKNRAVVAAGGKVTDPNSPDYGKLEPQYRPTVGQRIERGLRGVAEGLAGGGIRGAIAGAIDPSIVHGGQAYGAPNRQGQQEIRSAQGAVDSDQQDLTEMARRFKERQQAGTETARELSGIAANERANKPANATDFQVVGPNGKAHVATADEINSGNFQFASTYNKEDSADKTQPVINKKTHALEKRTDAEVNANPGLYEAVSTNNTIIRDSSGGSFIPVYDAQNNLHFYDPKTNKEVDPPAGLTTQKPSTGKGKAPDRTAFDAKWNNQFNVMERKYDARKNAVNKNSDLSAEEKQAEINSIEAERTAEKLGIQNEKDKAAEASGVYSQGNGQPNKGQQPNRGVTKADIPRATEARVNPKTGEKAYKIDGKVYRESELK